MTAASLAPPPPFDLERTPGPVPLLARILSNPVRMWSRRHFEEPVVVDRSALGTRVTVSAPEAVERVLVTKARDYPKDAMQQRLLERAAGRTLFWMADADAVGLRRVLSSALAPRARSSERDRAAALACFEAAEGRGPVDLFDLAGRAAARGLGTYFPDIREDEVAPLVAGLDGFSVAAGSIGLLDLMGAPGWMRGVPEFRARPYRRRLRALADAWVERAMARPDAPDAVPALVRWHAARGEGPDAVSETLRMLLGAGIETSAKALAWSLALCAGAPDVVARLRSGPEGDTVYARAVIDEAMRLYPPAPFLSRVAAKDDTLAGVPVEAGTVVIVAPWVCHRHRATWAEPDRFDPDRFMPGRREAIPRLAYFPFGAGPRACLAQASALRSLPETLSDVVRAFDVSTDWTRAETPLQRVTLGPSRPVMARVARHG